MTTIGTHQLAVLRAATIAHLREVLAGRQASRPGAALAVAVVARNAAEMRQRLQLARELVDGSKSVCDHANGIYFEPAPFGAASLAFVFPGQGAQYPGMLQGYLELAPFAGAVAQLDRIAQPLFGRSLRAALYGPDALAADALRETASAQASLGFVGAAMARTLAGFGVRPQLAAGHSYGELVALWHAGAYDEQALLRLTRERASLMSGAASAAPGGMAALSVDEAAALELLARFPGLEVANLNTARQTIVAGDSAALDRLEAYCAATGVRMVRLNTAAAFHTSRMQPALQGWSAFLTERCAIGDVGALRHARVVANVDAIEYPAEGRRAIAQRLTAQMSGKVRWIGCCERLYALGARIFVEVGPGSVLTRMMAQNLAGRPHLALSTDPGETDAQAHLAGLLAQLAVHGLALPAETSTTPGTIMQPNTMHHLVSDFYQQNSQLLERYFGLAERIIESGHSTPDVLRSFLDQGAQLTSAHLDANLRGLQLVRGGGAAVLEAAPVIAAPAPAPIPAPAPAPAPAATPLEAWLRNAIGEATGFPSEAIDPDTRFDDLGIDSLAFTELFTNLTSQFPQAREHAKELFGAHSIAAILAILAPRAEARQADAEAEPEAEAAQGDSIDGWLRAEIARLTGFPAASIDADAAFEDLGIDSLAFTELFTSLTGRYPQARELAKDLYQARTLGAVCRMLAPADEPANAAPAGRSPQLQALHERILDVLRTMRPDAAIVDDTSFESLNLNAFERQTLWQSTALATSPYLLAGEALMPVDSVGEALELLASMERRPAPRTEPAGADALCRYVQVEHARTLPAAQPLPRRVLLAGSGGAIQRRFQQSLASAGVAVQTLTLEGGMWQASNAAPVQLDDHRALASCLERLRDGANAMPIVFLTTPGGDDALERNATGMFCLAKALAGSQSARAAHGHLGVILTGGAAPLEAGARGVARSLSHEWRGELGVSSLALADADNADPLDSLRILLANDGVHDLTLRGGVLYQREAVPAPLEANAAAPALDNDSVVLLCGGGVGIGAEVAVDLARRHGCAIVALGRTGWDGADPYPQVKNDADLASAVYDDVKQAAGERKVGLAEVQEATQQARRRRALAQTAARVTAAGGRFMYLCADATNEHDLARAVAQVKHVHGRIDVAVHCAGTVEDRRVEDKPVESFRRVLHAKALSALHLQRALADCAPRHVMLFSSLVAHTGNAGQSDYCAANEVLNALAATWPGQGDALRVTSMLWSVWLETGLASRGVQALMERHGMAGIASCDGARYFHDELATGAREPWTLIASPRTLDVMQRGALLT